MFNDVYLIDDDSVFRHGLAFLLSEKFGLTISGSGCYTTQQELLVRSVQPNLLILGVSRQDTHVVEWLRRLNSQRHRPKITLLMGYEQPLLNDETTRLDVDAIVRKINLYQELNDVMSALKRRERYIGKDVRFPEPRQRVTKRVDVLVSEDSLDERARQRLNSLLSRREREVLLRIVNGLSASAIANEFGISVKTAEWHRRNLLAKLDVNNVAQLTKLAVREGFISLD